MKKTLKNIFFIIGLTSVLLFGVGATFNIATTTDMVKHSFPESINMLMLGIGLVGSFNFLKRKLSSH